jgi:hypothetical protein
MTIRRAHGERVSADHAAGAGAIPDDERTGGRFGELDSTGGKTLRQRRTSNQHARQPEQAAPHRR